MTERVSDAAEMVRRMSPRLLPGHFVFRTLTTDIGPADLASIRGMFREAEGLSVIRPARPGDADPYRQITLDVHSALDGVGLTAAVSGALAALDIPCNVVAANHHDHVFVPDEKAEAALAALRELAGAALEQETED